tara:strand:+ start:168 stop:572 length:405 start_codon:yes stop_codon:yes gene_type:complete
MKKLLIIFLVSASTITLNAQSYKNYFVSSKVLNLRNAPNLKSNVISKLKRYDNLRLIEKDSSNWSKVSYDGVQGYVFSKYIKKGKAIVTSYSYRTGAKCKDGSRIGATGRGACSHHRGVSYWLTRDKKSVRIKN